LPHGNTTRASKYEIARRIRQLEDAANAVHDFDSFRTYIATENRSEVENHEAELPGLIEPDERAKSLGQFYLVLYVMSVNGQLRLYLSLYLSVGMRTTK
jgi:hypothetical protein